MDLRLDLLAFSVRWISRFSFDDSGIFGAGPMDFLKPICEEEAKK
jgi:hypothetical protein